MNDQKEVVAYIHNSKNTILYKTNRGWVVNPTPCLAKEDGFIGLFIDPNKSSMRDMEKAGYIPFILLNHETFNLESYVTIGGNGFILANISERESFNNHRRYFVTFGELANCLFVHARTETIEQYDMATTISNMDLPREIWKVSMRPAIQKAKHCIEKSIAKREGELLKLEGTLERL